MDDTAATAQREEETEEATAVDATIVSHHFWPPLQEEELQVSQSGRKEGRCCWWTGDAGCTPIYIHTHVVCTHD